MSFTVFLGNLPTWVTADDIRGWLSAENLVADAIKVIRNPETQESKGFAFIDAPNTEEMNAIIRRFDRAPLEDRLLRANPAQPPRPKGQGPSRPQGSGHGSGYGGPPRREGSGDATGPAHTPAGAAHTQGTGAEARPPRRRKGSAKRPNGGGAQTPFAEELAKAL